jgi:hypothetical protein
MVAAELRRTEVGKTGGSRRSILTALRLGTVVDAGAVVSSLKVGLPPLKCRNSRQGLIFQPRLTALNPLPLAETVGKRWQLLGSNSLYGPTSGWLSFRYRLAALVAARKDVINIESGDGEATAGYFLALRSQVVESKRRLVRVLREIEI